MYYWLDSRNTSEYKAYPLYGWIFPCNYCGSPTSKEKTFELNIHKIYEYPYPVVIQCCKNCTNKRFNFMNIYRSKLIPFG
jgi:hypothetical protein